MCIVMNSEHVCVIGGTPALAPPPPFAPQYTFLPSPLMGRPPPPPPFYGPQILYWPYPSPPVSPPQPPSALVIMHTDPANLLHTMPEVLDQCLLVMCLISTLRGVAVSCSANHHTSKPKVEDSNPAGSVNFLPSRFLPS